MARQGWYEALVEALQKEDDAGLSGHALATKYDALTPSPPLIVMQLATIDPPNTPHVRTHIHRAFLTARAYPALPLLVTTTDVRTSKVAQLRACDRVEAVFWAPRARAQWRVQGRGWVVPEPGQGGWGGEGGVVLEALQREGFDWEQQRVGLFDAMSAHMKAAWCWPAPGTPLGGEGEDVATQTQTTAWPTTLPKLGDATVTEAERRDVAVALSNFALVVVEPFEVDHLELGVSPMRRTRYVREDARSVAFKATRVAP